MKILETAALTDEVYFAFIDLAAKYSDRFSFEMNEPISEKAVQTKRNIIMENDRRRQRRYGDEGAHRRAAA